MPKTPALDPHVLDAVLEGLEFRRQRIDEQMAAVRALLGRRPATRPAVRAIPTIVRRTTAARRKRTLSDESRERIAAAQRLRWKAYRKSHPASAAAPGTR